MQTFILCVRMMLNNEQKQVLDDRAMYVKFGLLSISLKIGGMVFITYTLYHIKTNCRRLAAEISHIYS